MSYDSIDYNWMKEQFSRRIIKENIRNGDVLILRKPKCIFILGESEGKRKNEGRGELLFIVSLVLHKSSLMNKWNLNKDNYQLHYQLKIDLL